MWTTPSVIRTCVRFEDRKDTIVSSRNALLDIYSLWPGMFPSEKLVVVEGQWGATSSLFVDNAFIIERMQSAAGWRRGPFLCVRIIDKAGESYLVRLPGEVFGGPEAITVRADQVQEWRDGLKGYYASGG